MMARDRGLKVLGLLIAISAAVSHVAFWYAFISVWCACAAVLSGWLWYLFHALSPRAAPAASGAVGP